MNIYVQYIYIYGYMYNIAASYIKSCKFSGIKAAIQHQQEKHIPGGEPEIQKTSPRKVIVSWVDYE